MSLAEQLELSPAAKQEMIVSLATLVLFDGGAETTAENISAVIKGTGNEVDAYWPGLFSKLCSGKDIGELLLSGGGGAGGAGPAAAGGAAAAAEEEEEEEEEKEEEIDMGGGAGLFGDDGDDDY